LYTNASTHVSLFAYEGSELNRYLNGWLKSFNDFYHTAGPT